MRAVAMIIINALVMANSSSGTRRMAVLLAMDDIADKGTYTDWGKNAGQ
jgi:hypothetical protein